MVEDLLVDVGNTNTKVATLQGNEISEVSVFPSETIKTHMQSILQHQTFRYAIFSSTKHLTDEMMRLFSEYVQLVTVSTELRLPFAISYSTPKTLGPDRICAVAGSQYYYPGGSNLVIDAGTCITYDLIRDGKFYDGGNISPGIHMRLKAMNTFTDALPMVEVNHEVGSLGTSTTTALQSGAIWGAAMEMRGFIQEYKEQFGELNIVLTGGDAPYFVNRLKTEIFVSPKLVLRGLGTILHHHVGNAS